MPTGTGGPNLRNIPVTKYQINPALFNQLTSRVVFPPINFALPAVGNYVQNQLLQVGIVGAINLIVKGTITIGTAAPTHVTPLYPFGLIDVQVSGNGQNNFISCNGVDLKLRQLAQARAISDGYSTFPNLAGLTVGAHNFQLAYRIPIAMDDTTLVGALYAQSEATNLTYKISTRPIADLFDNLAGGSTVAIAATVYLEEEIYEVPYAPNAPDTLVIPDLTVLHGLVANDNAVASQTTVDTQLFRINGQLERLFFYTLDKTTATAQVLVPTASYNYTQLIYGSNQTPYSFNPMDHLEIRNNRDYRVPLVAAMNGLNGYLWTAPFTSAPVPSGAYALDFVADNSARDQVLLEGVTNLRLRTNYAVAPTGGSLVHFVQETLFA